MVLADIRENDKLIERLSYLASSEKLSHAYIFEGDSSDGKALLADCFIKAIFCTAQKGAGCESCTSCHKVNHGNYEDAFYLEADGKSIKDEAVEALQEKLKKKPLFGDRNIAVIKDADTMTVRAQNRLLKTLEEPPKGAIIILLSENTENLVQTILSRCVIFRVNTFETEETGEMKGHAQEIVKMLLNKEPFYAVKIKLGDFLQSKESAIQLLDFMELTYRDLLMIESKESRSYKKADLFRAVELIEEARRDLQQGISTAYAMKNLIIKIGG